jgi:hypothetical protein
MPQVALAHQFHLLLGHTFETIAELQTEFLTLGQQFLARSSELTR